MCGISHHTSSKYWPFIRINALSKLPFMPKQRWADTCTNVFKYGIINGDAGRERERDREHNTKHNTVHYIATAISRPFDVWFPILIAAGSNGHCIIAYNTMTGIILLSINGVLLCIAPQLMHLARVYCLIFRLSSCCEYVLYYCC